MHVFLRKNIFKSTNKSFSTKITDKDKRLNQFFKLPKAKMDLGQKVFDHPEENISVLGSIGEEEIDKMDMIEKVIRKKKLESENKINKFMSNLSTRETIKLSENLIERLRLNKEWKFNDEFKEKEINNEYGNYDKYMENYKVISDKRYYSDDDGESRWQMKYNELNEKFNNKGGDSGNQKNTKNTIEEQIEYDLERYGSDYKFSDYLQMKQKENSGLAVVGEVNKHNKVESNIRESILEFDQDVLDDNPDLLNIRPFDKEARMQEIKKGLTRRIRREREPTKRLPREKERENRAILTKNLMFRMTKKGLTQDPNKELDGTPIRPPNIKIEGRVSPWTKQDIYSNFLEGWTIKDLSYKYGLIPERVKAIVWMRDLFWKEIYPKIGETGMRARLEQGYEYAKNYAYIDYGKDLEEMAYREQGVKIKKISRQELDCKPTKEIEEDLSSIIKKIKPKVVDHIPLRFYGKGPTGYLIKEMIVKRGKGSKRVSPMFQKYCLFKDLNPQLLPDRVIAKKTLGPRLATLGWRF